MESKRLTPTKVGKMTSKCLLLLLLYLKLYIIFTCPLNRLVIRNIN